MFKQALTTVSLIAFFVLSAFTGNSSQEKWIATLQLEGTKKQIILKSEAIYGGFNQYESKYFFFGKNHMFSNANDLDNAKIFNDMCITNASGQFQVELNNINKDNNSSSSDYLGNILFKKKVSIKGSVIRESADKIKIVIKEDLKRLGYTLTPEASKVMTGKFTLTIEKK